MKHLFLPYELALIAKEKGFEEPCLAYYGKSLQGVLHGNLWNGNVIEMGLPDNSKHVDCYAPLYQQIIDWLDEKCNMLLTFEQRFGLNGKTQYSCFIRYKVAGIFSSWVMNEKDHFWFDKITLRNKAIEEAFKLIL